MAKTPIKKTPAELLGASVQDKITNFKGIATSIVHTLSGSVQMSVDPGVDRDGKMRDAFFFDTDRLTFLKAGPMVPTPADVTDHIRLGHTARDRVTEVEGTVTEKVIHINGCTTILLTQRTAKKDERVLIVDWKRLDLAGSKQILAVPSATAPIKGGPVRKVERER